MKQIEYSYLLKVDPPFRECAISPPTKACCSLKEASNHLVTPEQSVRNGEK